MTNVIESTASSIASPEASNPETSSPVHQSPTIQLAARVESLRQELIAAESDFAAQQHREHEARLNELNALPAHYGFTSIADFAQFVAERAGARLVLPVASPRVKRRHFKGRVQISDAVRAEIVSELSRPDAVVRKVAKRYGVSHQTAYSIIKANRIMLPSERIAA